MWWWLVTMARQWQRLPHDNQLVCYRVLVHLVKQTKHTGDMFYLCFVNVIIEKFRRQPSTMNMASCHWMSGYLHSLLHCHVWHPFLSFLNPRLPQLFAHLTRGQLLHWHVLQLEGSITQPPSRAQFFGHCRVGHVAQGHGALTHRQFESLIGGAMNIERKHVSIAFSLFHYYCNAYFECWKLWQTKGTRTTNNKLVQLQKNIEVFYIITYLMSVDKQYVLVCL